MHEQPYSRPDTIEFDSELIKVLCLASAETVKGLQWALDQLKFSDRKYKLFLGDLQSISNHVEVDLVLVSVDIAQPVPLESLKRLAGKAGLCLFVQPTPQQLLSLAELPLWQAMSWDGASYDKLAIRLDEVGKRFEGEINKSRFVDSLKNFVLQQRLEADSIEWVNPPANYSGQKVFTLDPLHGILTVGGAESHCDIRLPLEKFGRSEIGEFRFIRDKWSFKLTAENAPVFLHGTKEHLKVGDQLEIQRFIMQIRAPRKLEELLRLSKRFHVLSDAELLPHIGRNGPATTLTVGELCRELLLSGISGEVRINSGTKSGLIYFNEGILYYAITGSVSGVKALTRIFSWLDPQWKINLQKLTSADSGHFRVTIKEFSRVYDAWKSQWQKVAPLVPPLGLRLQTNPVRFRERTHFSPSETKVLATLCEYPLVRDIMNLCVDLNDVDIVATLINLRKQGLIEPIRG